MMEKDVENSRLDLSPFQEELRNLLVSPFVPVSAPNLIASPRRKIVCYHPVLLKDSRTEILSLDTTVSETFTSVPVLTLRQATGTRPDHLKLNS